MTRPRAVPEQAFIPGTEPVKNAKVHNKAIAAARAQQEYLIAKTRRDDTHKVLQVAMEKEGLKEYEYDRVSARRIPSERVVATMTADPPIDLD